MRMGLIKILIISLILTILIEEITALFWGVRKNKDFLLILLVNVITNPLVVFLYYVFKHYDIANMLVIKLILELIAVSIEGVYFRVYGKSIKQPFLFSLCSNAVSFGIGILISIL